jgi:hypothetical protein
MLREVVWPRHSPADCRSRLGFLPGFVKWDLWQIKWNCGTFPPSISSTLTRSHFKSASALYTIKGWCSRHNIDQHTNWNNPYEKAGTINTDVWSHAVALFVLPLCYKPKGRAFDYRFHWTFLFLNSLILPAAPWTWLGLNLKQNWVPGIFFWLKRDRLVSRHISADCLENAGSSTTRNSLGRHGFLQECFLTSYCWRNANQPIRWK